MGVPCLTPTLRPFDPGDLPAVLDLVARAISPEEAEAAARALHHHFRCRAVAIDDGREPHLLEVEGKLAALAGLYDPPWETGADVWLSWLAVDPCEQGRGLGTLALRLMEEEARRRGKRRLFVETYTSPEYDRAVRFYRAQGFAQVGQLIGYMDDGDMVIFLKVL